jgi:hypothetical protein
MKGNGVVVGWGPRSADQECASGFFPLSTSLGFFLPVALLLACSSLVVACALMIAPCYGRSLVTYLLLFRGGFQYSIASARFSFCFIHMY